MEQPLVIVLPMHNQQRTLQATVHEVLELAVAGHGRIEVVVVDDASTDDTYETACELARVYPQLTVLRQQSRQGLRAVLELVRHRTRAEIVLMHDGVSAFNQVEVKHLLSAMTAARQNAHSLQNAAEMDNCGSRRLSPLRSLHDNMESAHRSISGFCWLKLDKPLVPRRRLSESESHRHDPPNVNNATPAPIAPVLVNLPTEGQALSLPSVE